MALRLRQPTTQGLCLAIRDLHFHGLLIRVCRYLTMACSLQIKPTALYSVMFTYTAVDAAGREVVLVDTNVTVLKEAEWIDVYGPNGRGCNGGLRIQVGECVCTHQSCHLQHPYTVPTTDALRRCAVVLHLCSEDSSLTP